MLVSHTESAGWRSSHFTTTTSGFVRIKADRTFVSRTITDQTLPLSRRHLGPLGGRWSAPSAGSVWRSGCRGSERSLDVLAQPCAGYAALRLPCSARAASPASSAFRRRPPPNAGRQTAPRLPLPPRMISRYRLGHPRGSERRASENSRTGPALERGLDMSRNVVEATLNVRPRACTCQPRRSDDFPLRRVHPSRHRSHFFAASLSLKRAPRRTSSMP